MVRAREIEAEITDEEYRDVLSELYGNVEICGMTFDSGYALQELDPTAFRCGKVDYESEMPSKWQCSECGDVFDDEDDAEECCQEDDDEEED